ncbi:hypothetical protein F53441_5039 [Fusarium austroafricanum]|uniref:Uncharacterized protein n=1 Tax=Fusarium austroafricanum TaxID=2364996 RepID=A0A8H4KKT9_9HYPO|nr:hypothetical protein F53441_5039 [Fusarium austroafricanum]
MPVPFTNESSPPEQLFLEYAIQDVLTGRWPHLVEPWATMYVDSIREQRYGDAIWARYHMEGNVKGGIIMYPYEGDRKPVLDEIKIDAMEAKTNEPRFFAEALELYAKASATDGHPEVIEILFEADKAEPLARDDEEEE